MFGRISTLDMIETQILDSEKALLENQHRAEHYQALANGNRVTLNRLQVMKRAEFSVNAPVQAASVKGIVKRVIKSVEPVKRPKLRAA